MKLRWNRVHRNRLLTLLMLAALCLSLLPPAMASATTTPLTEDFESYGTSASGYTLPVSSTSTAAQPWKTVVGGASSWAMGEESASPQPNHFLQQTDATTGVTYVLTQDQWGAAQPAITDSDITLSGKLKVTGANSTYAGLIARYSVSGTTATYYRFTMKKNSASYQFYLEKVTGNSKTSVPQTPGTPNASGVSVTNAALSPAFDSLGYLPMKLLLTQNSDGSLKLEGYYGSTMVLSGTDTTPYTSGQVGLYSYAGATAFDDITAATSNGSTPPGATVTVSSSTQLAQAINAASPGDIIELNDGNYAAFSITGKMGTAANPITIKAKNKGLAVFNAGPIKFTNSAYITLQDLTFVMDATAANWIRLTGCSNMRITNNHFYSPSGATDATKSNWVYIDGWSSHHNQVDHNLMENKKDRGKFILFDGNRDTTAGLYEITQYDLVEYNIFRNTLPRQANNPKVSGLA